MVTQSLLERQQSLLKTALNNADKWLSAIIVKRGDVVGIALIVLYARIMDLAKEFFDAHSNRLANAASFICRVQLEVYADLLNLINDPKYVDNIHASYLKAWLGLAESAEAANNPFLERFRSWKDFGRTKTRYRKELAALRAAGRGPIRPIDRLLRANLRAVHGAVYMNLSDNIHNNMQLLQKRHLREIDGKLQIAVRQHEQDENEWISMMDLIICTLVVATKQVHAAKKSEAQAEADEFDRAVEAEREQIRESLA